MSARRVRGFSLIGAMFVLVALGALAVYVVSIAGAQHASNLHAMLGTRADLAARAGIEWAMHDIVNNSASGLDCTPGTVSFNLTEAALDGFSVAVECSVAPITEGAGTYDLYSLVSIATRGTVGDADHAARTLVATVAR